jgi:hypothetical protein
MEGTELPPFVLHNNPQSLWQALLMSKKPGLQLKQIFLLYFSQPPIIYWHYPSLSKKWLVSHWVHFPDESLFKQQVYYAWYVILMRE